MATFVLILQALIALPTIGKYIEEALKASIAWYLSSQKADTLSQIADAAALGARAQSQEERFNASQKWRDVLSRARYNP